MGNKLHGLSKSFEAFLWQEAPRAEPLAFKRLRQMCIVFEHTWQRTVPTLTGLVPTRRVHALAPAPFAFHGHKEEDVWGRRMTRREAPPRTGGARGTPFEPARLRAVNLMSEWSPETTEKR